MRAGIETAAGITVDDTGARHKAKNGVCTQIGNERFAWFATTSSKSRLNFLGLLRAGHGDYVINAAALDYRGGRNLSGAVIALLTGHQTKRFADQAAWRAHLERLGITKLEGPPRSGQDRHRRARSWAASLRTACLREAVIVSDGAG